MRIYIDNGDRCPKLIGNAENVERYVAVGRDSDHVEYTIRRFKPLPPKSEIRRYIITCKDSGVVHHCALGNSSSGECVVFQSGLMRMYPTFGAALARYPIGEYTWEALDD